MYTTLFLNFLTFLLLVFVGPCHYYTIVFIRHWIPCHYNIAMETIDMHTHFINYVSICTLHFINLLYYWKNNCLRPPLNPWERDLRHYVSSPDYTIRGRVRLGTRIVESGDEHITRSQTARVFHAALYSTYVDRFGTAYSRTGLCSDCTVALLHRCYSQLLSHANLVPRLCSGCTVAPLL